MTETDYHVNKDESRAYVANLWIQITRCGHFHHHDSCWSTDDSKHTNQNCFVKVEYKESKDDVCRVYACDSIQKKKNLNL
jgi:hypothetical protein